MSDYTVVEITLKPVQKSIAQRRAEILRRYLNGALTQHGAYLRLASLEMGAKRVHV